MDDLKFKAPAPQGQVDAFDPTQTFAINDAAFVAADHPDIAILMVKPGHSMTLSQMMDELKVAGLHYSRVVVVSGRASPSTLGSPVHRLADNAVPH